MQNEVPVNSMYSNNVQSDYKSWFVMFLTFEITHLCIDQNIRIQVETSFILPI